MGFRSDVLAHAAISAYAELDETAGTTAVNDAGTGPDGTYNGTYTLNATPGPIHDGVDTGGWVSLDGNSSPSTHVDMGDHASYNFGDGAQSGFIFIARNELVSNLEQNIVDRGSNSYSIILNVGDVANKLAFLKSGVSVLTQSTVDIADTNQHMIAWTKNGAAIKLYVDGVDRTGSVTNATLSDPTGVGLSLGHYHAGLGEANMKIGRFALFNAVLSAAEIAAFWATAAGGGGAAIPVLFIGAP